MQMGWDRHVPAAVLGWRCDVARLERLLGVFGFGQIKRDPSGNRSC
jgi:hypothetical protein